MRLLPFTIKGNLATATIHQGGIHIERKRAGKINGSHSADIPWHQLAAIDFLEPKFFRNGHVHFATFNDPRGLTSTGNGNPMTASARNPHAILFAWHQTRAYKQLRDMLTGNGAVPPPQRPPPRAANARTLERGARISRVRSVRLSARAPGKCVTPLGYERC